MLIIIMPYYAYKRYAYEDTCNAELQETYFGRAIMFIMPIINQTEIEVYLFQLRFSF